MADELENPGPAAAAEAAAAYRASPRGVREPGVSFSEFVLGLGANAAHLMGSDDDALEVAPRADLASAAQFIDALIMLQEKTRGNLTEDEQKLLDSLLYDLRMRYLELAQAQSEDRAR